MKKEESKEFIKERWRIIVRAVFSAEHKIQSTTDAKKRLKEQTITPGEYVDLIIDEILKYNTEK